jgi:transposase
MKIISTVGMDMGDKSHVLCILDHEGEILKETSVANTASSIQCFFSKLPPCRVVLEAGTHSGWVSRVLEALGHEVLVGNPRKLRVIWDSDEKSDQRDAEMLARIGRFDPKLLHPIHHRGERAQSDLAVVKARMMVVKLRSSLITHTRGTVKALGHRISTCSPECFHKRLSEEMPEALGPALTPLINAIETMNTTIAHYDKQIKWMCQDRYPETQGLMAIGGVGPVTVLGYVLTLEDPTRFRRSRSAGAFFGLTPKRDQSGQVDKPLGITKAGNTYMRSLLVNCAQYILGAHGPDCDLRRAGLKIAAQGGKIAKRRAVVAVARKLAVLMHELWSSGNPYDPFYQQKSKTRKAA